MSRTKLFKVGDHVATTVSWNLDGKTWPAGHTGTITKISGEGWYELNDDPNQRYFDNELQRDVVWVRYDRSQSPADARVPVAGDRIRVMGMEHTVTKVRGTWAQGLELEGVEYSLYIVPARRDAAQPEVGELLVDYVEIAVPKPVRVAPTEEGIYVTAKQELVRLKDDVWYDIGAMIGSVLNASWIVADEQWPLRKVVTTEV